MSASHVTTPELPPLPQWPSTYFAKAGDAAYGILEVTAYCRAREARERILMARIAELEALLAKHELRLQMGWLGKHAYLQAMPIEGGEEAITIAQVSKGSRMRWRFDNEAERPFRWERVQCGECGAVVPEARR